MAERITVEIVGALSHGSRRYAPGDVVEGRKRDLRPLIDAGHARLWADPWTLSMGPAAYLEQYPNGPNAALAKKHLERENSSG